MNRATQRPAILRLLIEARGAWVPLPEIKACAAQYNARIFELRKELRKQGFNIENRTELIIDVRHSWYRLVESPAEQPPKPEPPEPPATMPHNGDWYERETGKPRPSSATANDLPLFDSAVHP